MSCVSCMSDVSVTYNVSHMGCMSRTGCMCGMSYVSGMFNMIRVSCMRVKNIIVEGCLPPCLTSSS